MQYVLLCASSAKYANRCGGRQEWRLIGQSRLLQSVYRSPGRLGDRQFPTLVCTCTVHVGRHVHVYIQCMVCTLCNGVKWVWLSLPSEEEVKKIESLRKMNRECERERTAVSGCLPGCTCTCIYMYMYMYILRNVS